MTPFETARIGRTVRTRAWRRPTVVARLHTPRRRRPRRITVLGDWTKRHRWRPTSLPSLVLVAPFGSTQHRQTTTLTPGVPAPVTLRPTVTVTHSHDHRHVTHRPQFLQERGSSRGTDADTPQSWRADRRLLVGGPDERSRPSPDVTTSQRRPAPTDADDTAKRDHSDATATLPELRSITRHRPIVGRLDTARDGLARRRSAAISRTWDLGRRTSTAVGDGRPETAVGDGRPETAVGASARSTASSDRLAAGPTPASVGRTDRSAVPSTGAVRTDNPDVPADTTVRASSTPAESGRGPAVSFDLGSAGDRASDSANRRSPPLVVAQGADDSGGSGGARGSSGLDDGTDAGRRGTARHATAGDPGDRPTTGRSALGDTASSAPTADDVGSLRSAELPSAAIDRIVDRLSDRLARDRRIARERGGHP